MLATQLKCKNGKKNFLILSVLLLYKDILPPTYIHIKEQFNHPQTVVYIGNAKCFNLLLGGSVPSW